MSLIDLFKSRESREKLSHLKALVAVAFALCKATAIALGFRHEVIDAMIMHTIEDIKRNTTIQTR